MKKTFLMFFNIIFLCFFTGCGIRIIDVEDLNSSNFQELRNIEEKEISDKLVKEYSNEEDNSLEEINECDTYYGKVLGYFNNKLLVYSPLGELILDTDESIDIFERGDYISFEIVKTDSSSYPLQIFVKNLLVSNIDFYMESFYKEIYTDKFYKPYTNGDIEGILWETEIIDILPGDNGFNSYICNSYEGIVIFYMNSFTDYKIGDFVDFYTDGNFEDTFPLKVKNVFKTELVEVE